MTTPSPAEQLNTSVTSLQNELGSLQSRVRMAEARDALGDLDARLKGLPQAVRDLRGRGYAFETGLEGQVLEMVQRWGTIQPAVASFIDQQAAQLEQSIQPVEGKVSYLAGQANDPEYALGQVKEVETEIENLGNKVSGAVSTAAGMYSEFSGQFQKIDRHLSDLKYTVEQVEQGCFKLLPTEGAILAVKATWTRDGREDRDDPQGVLYLTDQRLLFEQKQEVATKKVLFITTERKLVQQVALEIPVDCVTEVKGSKQGLFRNEDFLDMNLGSGAPVRAAQFHLFGQDCQAWVGLFNRVRAHEFDHDRVIQIDQAEAEKVKNAPTNCPACSGAITQVIVRGQDTITCEYCGHVIRL